MKYVTVSKERKEILYRESGRVVALISPVATRAGELWLCKLSEGAEIWPLYTEAAARARISQELNARGYSFEAAAQPLAQQYAPAILLLAIMALALVAGALIP